MVSCAIDIPVSLVDVYRRDGAVCVRGAFDDACIDLLRGGVDRDIAAPGPLHTVQQGAEEPGYFLTDFCMAQRLPEFRSFIFESPAAAIAARLMGASRVSFFYDAMWVKDRATPKRTRWHQDQPYYPVDGSQFCAIWVPLDPVDADSGLELVRGSHRWGRWFAPELTRRGQDLYGAAGGPFERMPDIEADRSDYEIVSWSMQPGDCIVFHALTVHDAPGNRSHEHRRRAVSTFWMGDAAVFAERPGKVRPLFEGHRLRPGDPMECPWFPRVWPDPDANPARFSDRAFRISI